MATRVSDSGGAADRQRRVQAALVRFLLRDLRAVQALLVPVRPASARDWIAAVTALVGQYSAASAAAAATSYEEQRAAAGIRRRFAAEPAPAPPDEQVEASLRWAASDVWDGGSVATARTRTEGAMERLVLNRGRDTMQQAVRQDREAVAWARGAALGACSFCKLMASRGAVYESSGTAGREADARFEGDTGEAKYHNFCHCVIIPVFRGQTFQLSPQAAEWDRLYREYAQGHPGDQLRLFRRALAEHDSNPLPVAH
ncbi:hypothetical protein ACIPMW_32460 [Streptomyces sp. NPDC086669]|uniref:VG15 protein n=1 Tax=Streptomyces sp. NPDC086669 TaxID=3365753 RepID=UPI003829D7FC